MDRMEFAAVFAFPVICSCFCHDGGIVHFSLQSSDRGFFDSDEVTYEYHGSTYVLYQDEIPLTVEDMLDLQYDGYSRECSTEETVFLKRMDVF